MVIIETMGVNTADLLRLLNMVSNKVLTNWLSQFVSILTHLSMLDNDKLS